MLRVEFDLAGNTRGSVSSPRESVYKRRGKIVLGEGLVVVIVVIVVGGCTVVGLDECE